MENLYDLIIIGGGPSGLSAGLYGARGMMNTLILEKEPTTGGQIFQTHEIENYPGTSLDETGPSLVAKMEAQAKNFGAELKYDAVVNVELHEKIKTVECKSGTIYKAKSVIISTGASPRKLGVPGEEEFTGKGVSYCGTCDAFFFRGLEVYAIGGGDTAIEEALFLTKFAKKVTVIHRRDKLRAAKSLQDRAFKNEKIEFMWDTVVEEISGEKEVNSMKLKNLKTGEVTEVNANPEDKTFGVFVFVGYIPNTDMFKGVIQMTQGGYLIADHSSLKALPPVEDCCNLDGVYIVGDCREKLLYQVITATADGAIAATQAEKYVDRAFEE